MPGAIDEVMQRLQAQAAELWPGVRLKKIAITNQIQRPYSNTFRLALLPGDLAPGAQCPTAVYAKIIRPTDKNRDNTQKYVERLQKEFEVARMLQKRLPAVAEYGTVRPVAHFGDLLCLVSEEAPGRMLAELIAADAKRWHKKARGEKTARHCQRAGKLLAALQSVTAVNQPLEVGEILEYVDIRLQRLVESAKTPFSPSDANNVRKYLEKTLASVPGEQLRQCGSHSDYAPFNLLADEARLTVFDFAMFKTGSIYNDVAYFCHRLEGYLHKPTFSRGKIHGLQRAFLEGYNQASPCAETRIENDQMFRVFSIKHVINNYSAIMRQRVVGASARLSLPVRLFNRRVFQRYNDWLLRTCS